MGHLHALLLVFVRALKVLAIAVPILLFLILASAMGPGGSRELIPVFLTLGLCGVAWAFLPLVHISRWGGLGFGAFWSALAVGHVAVSAPSTTGTVVVCWLLASLFLALRLKAKPPGYFPQGWKDAAADRAAHDASRT